MTPPNVPPVSAGSSEDIVPPAAPVESPPAAPPRDSASPPPADTSDSNPGVINTIFFDASFGNAGWASAIDALHLTPRSLLNETSTYQFGAGMSFRTRDSYFPYFRFQLGDAQLQNTGFNSTTSLSPPSSSSPVASFFRWRLEGGLEEFSDSRWFPNGGGTGFFVGAGTYHRLGLTLGTTSLTRISRGGVTEDASGTVFRLGITNDRDLLSTGFVLNGGQAFELGLGLYLPVYNSRESLINIGEDSSCASGSCPPLRDYLPSSVYAPVRLTARYFPNGIPGEYSPNSPQASTMALLDSTAIGFSNLQQRRTLVTPVVTSMADQLLFSFGTQEQYGTLHTTMGALSLLDGINEGMRQRDIAQVVRHGNTWQRTVLGVQEGLLFALGVYGAASVPGYPNRAALMRGEQGAFGAFGQRALRMGLMINSATDLVGVLDGVGAFGGDQRPFWADFIIGGVGAGVVLAASPLSGNGAPGGDIASYTAFSDGGLYFREPHDVSGENFLWGKERLYALSVIGSGLIWNGFSHLMSLATHSRQPTPPPATGASSARRRTASAVPPPHFEFGGTWAGGRDVFLQLSYVNW